MNILNQPVNVMHQPMNVDARQVNLVDAQQVHQQVMHMAAANNVAIGEFIRHTGADPNLVPHMLRDHVEQNGGGGGNPPGPPPPPALGRERQG